MKTLNKTRKTTRALQPTEHQIQTSIVNYLRATGWYVMRLNSGKYSVGEGRSRRFINGQEKGTPDLMAFRQQDFIKQYIDSAATYLLFIEVKRPGNKPTLAQEMKMKELEEYGAKCIVATNIESLVEGLK